MQTVIYRWKLDESFSYVFFFWKKCQSGGQSLCISPQHGICIPVAMAIWLLWDQFIWRSGSCRCHWVLLSVTRLWSNYRPLKAHTCSLLLPSTDSKDFSKDRKMPVECQTVWKSSSSESLAIICHPSSDHSVKNTELNVHLEVFGVSDEYHKMPVKIKVLSDIQTPTPPPLPQPLSYR